MIERILPGRVASAEAFGDLAALLFAEEEAQLAGANGKRRNEFASARRCARRALGTLGIPPVAIPRGRGGAPRWPAGIVGSLTHCAGYRAAAVAMADDVSTIGIDAEPARPLPHGVLGLIASPAERDHLAALAAAEPAVCWDRLLFCAKEAVYKAWFPLTGAWLGFAGAAVELDPAGTFRARLLVADPRPAPAVFAGRWLAARGLLIAAITVTTAAAGRARVAAPAAA